MAKSLNMYIFPQDPDCAETVEIPEAERRPLEQRALTSFQTVLDNASHIQYDHFLVYYTRKCGSACFPPYSLTSFPDYELGRLKACQGDIEAAKQHLELVMAGA
jgi:hypothetical protein